MTSLKDLARKERPNPPSAQDWAQRAEDMEARIVQIGETIEEAREEAQRLRDRAKHDDDNHDLRRQAEEATGKVRGMEQERDLLRWKIEQQPQAQKTALITN